MLLDNKTMQFLPFAIHKLREIALGQCWSRRMQQGYRISVSNPACIVHIAPASYSRWFLAQRAGVHSVLMLAIISLSACSFLCPHDDSQPFICDVKPAYDETGKDDLTAYRVNRVCMRGIVARVKAAYKE